jgi:hypothetical protein
MSYVRPLALLFDPVFGESFSSYVERLAALHDVQLIVMLRYLGLIEDERYERIRGYGIFLNPVKQQAFCTATALSREKLNAMLLYAYHGLAINLNGVESENPSKLFFIAANEWAYFSGSHACPHCLAESNGAWRLAWKIPWSFVCAKHQSYLVGVCPSCRKRLASGRIDRSLSPVFVRHVPVPGRCGNPKVAGEAVKGKGANPCGHVLATIPTERASTTMVTYQERIDRLLSGTQPAIFGKPVSVFSYFMHMRSLCAFLFYCAELEDLSIDGDIGANSFESFSAERNKKLAEHLDSKSPRNEARTRTYLGAPTDPLLIAAVTGTVFFILDSCSIEEMAVRLNPFIDRCKLRTAKTAWWEIPNYFHFDGQLLQGFRENLAISGKFDRMVGNRSNLMGEKLYQFEPRHIPQQISLAAYNELFAPMFPDMLANHVRGYVSMSLVRLCGNFTWLEAAKLLDLPDSRASSIANRVATILNSRNQMKDFGKQLHILAARFSEADNKIDYQWRRSQFASFTEIDWIRWKEICVASNVTLGSHGPQKRSRNCYATAWLWADLTSGDWTLAPSLREGNKINTREVYRQLEKRVFPRLEQALRSYGEILLKEKYASISDNV